MNYFFFVTCLFACFGTGMCYLPVLAIPGFNDFTNMWDLICAKIKQLHNGTECFKIQPFTFAYSNVPMWIQLKTYSKIVQGYFDKYPGGVHMIGHSQGTLMMRALVVTTPNHPVKNFISLCGPFMGMFGAPFANQDLLGLESLNLNKLTQSELTDLFYSPLGQNTISLAGFWNDPTRRSEFLTKCSFLPTINCLNNHSKTADYKAAYLRLNKTVLMAGSLDTEVIPWQTERGELYYPNNTCCMSMKEHDEYVYDTFGLRTQDEQGRLFTETVPAAHNDFVLDLSFVEKYYIQHLT